MCETVKGHYSIINQLERSATSIGANIHEANYAHSKPDFIAKMQIALKECYETEYWIEVLVKSEIVKRDNAIPFTQAVEQSGVCSLLQSIQQKKIIRFIYMCYNFSI